MPKRILEIKDFLLKARKTDAKSVKIIRTKDKVKFKVKESDTGNSELIISLLVTVFFL
jgi:hypothetical protein